MENVRLTHITDHVELWPLERLRVPARVPRQHSPAQVEQIATSFQEFGFNTPLAVDPSGEIILGVARYLAAQGLNLTEVPVVVLHHLTAAQKRAYRIADNQLALNASWDEKVLRAELDELVKEAYRLDFLGIAEEELKRLLESPELRSGITDEDDVPACEPALISKPGDLWLLNEHRLLCGDATLASDVALLMQGEQAGMAFLDPPYNTDYKQASQGGRRILNDNLGAQFGELLHSACINLLAAVDGAVYICMSSAEVHTLMEAFLKAGGHFSTFLVFVKDHFAMGRSDYHHRFEPILYGWRKGVKRFWCGDRKQSDVWNFPKPRANDLHPTMKPVALIEQAIRNSSPAGAVVLDPFAGSGSSVIACQKTGRRARAIELDPHYVDVIVRRWQDFTGLEARLESDQRTFAEVTEARLALAAEV